MKFILLFALIGLTFGQYREETCDSPGTNEKPGYALYSPGAYHGDHKGQVAPWDNTNCDQICTQTPKCWGFFFVNKWCALYLKDVSSTKKSAHSKTRSYRKCGGKKFCDIHRCAEGNVLIWEAADTECTTGTCTDKLCCEKFVEVCNPDWKDKSGVGCADYKKNMYCTYDGKEGANWFASDGKITDRKNMVNRESALVCPECGCGDRQLKTMTDCDPLWKNRAGQSCSDFERLAYCTKDGDFGTGWYNKWGWFDDRGNKNRAGVSALTCPQCGCKNDNVCKPGTWSTTGMKPCTRCSTKCDDPVSQKKVSECTLTSDLRCEQKKRCKAGQTYSKTGYASCKRCKVCGQGEEQEKACTVTSNTVCKIDLSNCKDSNTCIAKKWGTSYNCGKAKRYCSWSSAKTCCPVTCGICEGEMYSNKGQQCRNYCFGDERDGTKTCDYCGEDDGEKMFCCKEKDKDRAGMSDNCKNAVYSSSVNPRYHSCVSNSPPKCKSFKCPAGMEMKNGVGEELCNDKECTKGQCCKQLDRYHQLCDTDAQCNSGGRNGYDGFCDWCGLHNGEQMVCCNPMFKYPDHSACKSVDSNHHLGQMHCTPVINEEDIPDKFGQPCGELCWHYSDGTEACDACGKHNGQEQFCCATIHNFKFPQENECHRAAIKNNWIYTMDEQKVCTTQNPDDAIHWTFTKQENEYVDIDVKPHRTVSCMDELHAKTDLSYTVCEELAEEICVEMKCKHFTINTDTYDIDLWTKHISDSRIQCDIHNFYVVATDEPWNIEDVDDRHHLRCQRKCPNNGYEACGWCGRHEGELMYCCSAKHDKTEDHNCYSTDWNDSLEVNDHYCLMKKPVGEGYITPVRPPPIPQPKPKPEPEEPDYSDVDRHGEECARQKNCWNGWEECDWCGLHGEQKEKMHCCWTDGGEVGHNPCTGAVGLDKTKSEGSSQCVTIDKSKVAPWPNNHFQNCECKDNGKPCKWCGKHNGKTQACCKHKQYYGDNQCKNALFDPTNKKTSHCVVIDPNQPQCVDSGKCSAVNEDPNMCGRVQGSCTNCCACKFAAGCNIDTMGCEANKFLEVIDDTQYMEQKGWIIQMCMKELSTRDEAYYCNGDKGYWYGWHKDGLNKNQVGEVGFTTLGSGKVTIEFGNCGQEGVVRLYKNGREVEVASATKLGTNVDYKRVVIDYKNRDHIKMRDENGHAIVNIKSVKFSCDVVDSETSETTDAASFLENALATVHFPITDYSFLGIGAIAVLMGGLYAYMINKRNHSDYQWVAEDRDISLKSYME